MEKTFENQLQKLKRNQKMLIIIILLFVLILIWTFISLFTSQKTEVTSPELVRLAAPLSPSLDTDTLENLQTQRSFTEEELSDFPIFKILVSADGRAESVVPIQTTIEEFEQQLEAVSPTPLPTVTPAFIGSASALFN